MTTHTLLEELRGLGVKLSTHKHFLWLPVSIFRIPCGHAQKVPIRVIETGECAMLRLGDGCVEFIMKGVTM